MIQRLLLAASMVLAAMSLNAEVIDSGPSGFTSQHVMILAASPDEAYLALTDEVASWWDASHSYSGDPHAFTLDPRAGGCFCEEVGGVSVEHMRVGRAIEGQRLVMLGGLGPLQDMAVSGSMTFLFKPHAQGTELTYRYVVGGYVTGGLEAIAPAVDQVQRGQLDRLQAFLATGEPLNP